MDPMEHTYPARAFISPAMGLTGASVVEKEVRLSEMLTYYGDPPVALPPADDRVVYRVSVMEDPGGRRPGGLCFGVTRLMPGDVNGEYHMTRGHLHVLRDRAEYYWGIQGRGFLLCAPSDDGEPWVEEVAANTVHYVPAGVAHRLANTGPEPFVVGACWPSDAGHDYETPGTDGFGVRVMRGTDGPELCRR